MLSRLESLNPQEVGKRLREQYFDCKNAGPKQLLKVLEPDNYGRLDKIRVRMSNSFIWRGLTFRKGALSNQKFDKGMESFVKEMASLINGMEQDSQPTLLHRLLSDIGSLRLENRKEFLLFFEAILAAYPLIKSPCPKGYIYVLLLGRSCFLTEKILEEPETFAPLKYLIDFFRGTFEALLVMSKVRQEILEKDQEIIKECISSWSLSGSLAVADLLEGVKSVAGGNVEGIFNLLPEARAQIFIRLLKVLENSGLTTSEITFLSSSLKNIPSLENKLMSFARETFDKYQTNKKEGFNLWLQERYAELEKRRKLELNLLNRIKRLGETVNLMGQEGGYKQKIDLFLEEFQQNNQNDLETLKENLEKDITSRTTRFNEVIKGISVKEKAEAIVEKHKKEGKTYDACFKDLHREVCDLLQSRNDSSEPYQSTYKTLRKKFIEDCKTFSFLITRNCDDCNYYKRYTPAVEKYLEKHKLKFKAFCQSRREVLQELDKKASL